MTLTFGGGAGVLTIPGLSSDGLTPGGIVVAGATTAGDASASGIPTFHILNGVVQVVMGQAGIDDFDPGISVTENGSLSSDVIHAGIQIHRELTRNGHTADTAAFRVLVFGLDGAPPAGELVCDFLNCSINYAGFIGLGGKTPPTAARTLAQATITAITDANAKAAVQACANALSDMGALTLT